MIWVQPCTSQTHFETVSKAKTDTVIKQMGCFLWAARTDLTLAVRCCHMTSRDPCLKRSHLIAHLSVRILVFFCRGPDGDPSIGSTWRKFDSILHRYLGANPSLRLPNNIWRTKACPARTMLFSRLGLTLLVFVAVILCAEWLEQSRIALRGFQHGPPSKSSWALEIFHCKN